MKDTPRREAFLEGLLQMTHAESCTTALIDYAIAMIGADEILHILEESHT